jgi:hypothetical protein
MLNQGDTVVLTTSEGWESPAGTIFNVEQVEDSSITLHSIKTGYIHVLAEYLKDFQKMFYMKITEKWSHGHSGSVYFVFEDEVDADLLEEDFEDECEVFLDFEQVLNRMSEHYRGFDWEQISRETYMKEKSSFVSSDVDLNIVFHDEKVTLSRDLFSLCIASGNPTERGVVAKYVLSDLNRRESI